MTSFNCPRCGNSIENSALQCEKCGFADTAFIQELNQTLNEAHEAAPQPDYKRVDRRRQERIKNRIRVLMNGRPAILIDISEGGIRLSAESLPADPRVEITLLSDTVPITLEGEIRWYSQLDPLIRHREAGIAFSQVPDSLRDYLKNLEIRTESGS